MNSRHGIDLKFTSGTKQQRLEVLKENKREGEWEKLNRENCKVAKSLKLVD